MSREYSCDYLIIGAGIIGLSIAKHLKEDYPNSSIIILEKEREVAMHSSGRNSGVLHAGFYYTADSLKAKFTKEGNRELTSYCQENGLKINRCQKVVIANDESELESLEELYKRGVANGVSVELITEEEVSKRFKNVRTYKKALFSPDTATVDPVEISTFIYRELEKCSVEFLFDEGFSKKIDENQILTTKNSKISAKKIINCAGLYADRVAQDFGFSKNYTIIPFKGIYLKYTKEDRPIDTNIYPVPNLNNPFLGVHYTVTVDNVIKIGPTAIPAFWRENYGGLDNFSLREFLEIAGYELKLFYTNAFNFRALAYEEIKKYYKPYFTNLALKMVNKIDKKGFTTWSRPGIRAQLLDVNSLELLQDFVVEGDKNSIHVLNAVSPAFTSSFPFSRWIIENYIKDSGEK